MEQQQQNQDLTSSWGQCERGEVLGWWSLSGGFLISLTWNQCLWMRQLWKWLLLCKRSFWKCNIIFLVTGKLLWNNSWMLRSWTGKAQSFINSILGYPYFFVRYCLKEGPELLICMTCFGYLPINWSPLYPIYILYGKINAWILSSPSS